MPDDETLEDIAEQSKYHVDNRDVHGRGARDNSMKNKLAKSKLKRALIRAKHTSRRVTLAVKA